MRRRSGLSWSLATLLLARALGAQAPPSTIILTFDASSEAQKQAITAIRAHVSGLPADVVVVPVEHLRSLDSRLAAAGSLAASRQALGTFYIEIEPDGTLLIFFTEAGAEATLVRRLPPNDQGVRVALEQAAIVVRSLVEALLEGGTVGIAREAERGRSAEEAEAPAEPASSAERPSAEFAVSSPEEPPSQSDSRRSRAGLAWASPPATPPLILHRSCRGSRVSPLVCSGWPRPSFTSVRVTPFFLPTRPPPKTRSLPSTVSRSRPSWAIVALTPSRSMASWACSWTPRDAPP
jgi:hypothetical protein